MPDSPRNDPTDAPLNRALKNSKEKVYDTRNVSPAPFDTTSAKERQADGWPVIWLVVVIVCLGIAAYLFT